MSQTIQLEIVSSTEAPFKASITQLYIPAYLGETGILGDHKPYVSLLQPGEVFYTDIHGKDFYLYIHDGFVEVNDNSVVLISDSVERGENLKREEIEAKLSDLEKQIQALSGKDMSDEEMKDAPDKINKAIEERKEYNTKLGIVNKLKA